MNKEITLEQLASYETAFDSDRANRIAMDLSLIHISEPTRPY